MTSPTLRRSTALADEQRGDLGAVEHRAAADGQADPGAEEEAAEHRGQHQVGRHVRVGNEREHDGEARDRQRAAHGERRAPCGGSPPR